MCKVTVREGPWESVALFANEQLKGFDLSMLDWFRLGITRINPFSGHCQHPKRIKKGSHQFAHGYRITASVHPERTRYPWTEQVAIGTEQHDDGRFFTYIKTPVEYATAEESLIHVVGHEAFHFLRHSKQIPGRNTEPSANRYGIEWLAEWRQR